MAVHRIFRKQEEQFLLARLQKEWLQAERAQKLHEVAQLAKTGGVLLGKSLLTFAAIAGVLSVAAVAPNAFAAYGKLARSSSRRFYNKQLFVREMKYLRKRGYIRARMTSTGYRIETTPKGKARMLRKAFTDLVIRKQERWDGTWWIAMFDIPRRHNAERNGFRDVLRRIGMQSLQASVFVSRHPCREEVWFVARLFSMENYITIAHVHAIEGYGDALAQIVEA